MRVAIIGRTEVLYDTAVELRRAGHDIACIVTAKEAPESRRTSEDFRKIADQWGIPFAKTPKINECFELLSECACDIGVSINYSGVIPSNITDMFPMGILNAHGGDLPRYRGNACQAWAIINGEERIGLCIHRMVGGELDSGDIIDRSYLKINLSTKIGHVMDWIKRVTPSMFVNALNRLSEDPDFILEKQSTRPEDSLRCYPRIPSDGRIDWHASADDVVRLVNASGLPYQGAFFYLKEQKIEVWDACPINVGNILAVPGQVIHIAEDYVEVATRSGAVRLSELSIGGCGVNTKSVFNSIRIRLS